MSIQSLSNYKSARYMSSYLKLLPVASRERPPQAKEFEDIQDILINPIYQYAKTAFNDVEVLSGLRLLRITPSSITLSPGRILLNNYPLVVETQQEVISINSASFTLYLDLLFTVDSTSIALDYTITTTASNTAIPILRVDAGILSPLTKSRSEDYIQQQLFEIYGNFVSWGLTYNDNCVSPGVVYINGTRYSYPYHSPVTTTLSNYVLVVNRLGIQALNPLIKLDSNSSVLLGYYLDGKWQPNKYAYQITSKQIRTIETGLAGLRDYLLESTILTSIDTTSNLLADTFNNEDKADTYHVLYDCEIFNGSLSIGKLTRLTNSVAISNNNTNVKLVNGQPSILIQNYTATPYIQQKLSDSFITTNISSRGILKLQYPKLNTSIYKSTKEVTTLLTQLIVNAEVYGLTPNSSEFSLTIGSILISTSISTNASGYAAFSFSLPARSSINDVITVQNAKSSATSSLLDNSYGVDNTYIGQTFEVTAPTTLVELDIYIRRVTTNNPLIKVLVARYTDKPQEVIGQAIVELNNIRASVDATLPTRCVFDVPITLSKGIYCLLICTPNSPIDLFISNQSLVTNGYLFTQDAAQTTTTQYLNKDLMYTLYSANYVNSTGKAVLTINDALSKFDHLYYPDSFKINNIEYINEASTNSTNSLPITIDVNKYAYIRPCLISSKQDKAIYVSKTIRTNFAYSTVYAELDAIILDSTYVDLYISSNQTYTWEKLNSNYRYLVDGNDQTYKYVFEVPLNKLVKVVTQQGTNTQATRNYLTVRIDLRTESDNRPLVKAYKVYVK
jgi:hypothetical protein